jgi:RecG-like helicase
MEELNLDLQGNSATRFVMTATPFREHWRWVYGDLDIFSVIDELPPGRKPFRPFIVLTATEFENSYEMKSLWDAKFILCNFDPRIGKMDFKD